MIISEELMERLNVAVSDLGECADLSPRIKEVYLELSQIICVIRIADADEKQRAES